MSFLGSIFKFFFGWLDDGPKQQPYNGGIELRLDKPNEEPLVYGEVENSPGVVVASHLFNPQDGDDIPNDILLLQIVWSVGSIESIDKIYLDDVDIDSNAFDASNSNGYTGSERWVYYWNVPNGADFSLSAIAGIPKITFKGNGHAYTIIRLEYDPEKMSRYPKITADLKGQKLTDLGAGSKIYRNNYAHVIWDYMTNTTYGAGKLGRLNKASFEAERDFSGQMVTPYDGGVQQPLMSCNVRLDCNDDVGTNLRKLLKGCRGFLPYIKGEFQLIIERERIPTTFEITDENRLSDFVVEDNSIKDRFNLVHVRYFDREQKGKVATATYPTDSVEHLTYLAEDDNQLLDKTFTIDTINNEYEALQAAEIILKRSRNALRAKVTGPKESRDISVGMVMPVNNEAFGMASKPFIVTSKASHASGKQDFELLEYQPSIYPWNEKPAQIIPDSYLPNYWEAETPYNLSVGLAPDGSTEIVFSWQSRHFSFLVFLDDEPIARVGLQEYRFSKLEAGNHEFAVIAYNRVGYPSGKSKITFEVGLPEMPVVTINPGNFNLEVIPSVNTYFLSSTFHLKINEVNDFSTALDKGLATVFNIGSLKPNTDYFVWVRTENIVGVSDWVAVTTKTTNDPTILGEFLNVKSLRLASTSQLFAFDNPNPASPSAITFTVKTINIDTGADPLVWSTSPNVPLTGSGDSRVLSAAAFGSNNSVAVTVATTSGSFSDTITVIRLESGGIGADALAGYLTNESHVIAATDDGTIVGNLAAAGGQFKVYLGLTDVTGSCTFTASNANGMTASINTSGVYSISSVTADDGTITFEATFNGVTLSKVYSITKAKSGLSGQRGSVHKHWDVSGVAPPNNTQWSDAQAFLAITDSGLTPAALDTVTLFNNVEGFSETRFLDSDLTTWLTVQQVIDGNLLVDGTVGARKIIVDELFAKDIVATGSIAVDNGTVRAALSANGDPISVITQDGKQFGVDAAGNLFFAGTLGANTIGSLSVFTPAVRNLILSGGGGGSGGQTGGSDSVSNVSASGSVVTTRTLEINPANGNPVTIGVMVSDVGSSTPAPLIQPEWNVKIYRGATVIHNQNYSGTVVPRREDTTPATYDYHLSFDANVSITDNSHNTTSGDPLAYTIEVSKVSGSHVNCKIRSFSISQAIISTGSGGGGISTIDQAGDTYFDNLQDKEVLTYDSAQGLWINKKSVSKIVDAEDTDVDSPVDGEALVYDSTKQKWVNGPSGSGGKFFEIVSPYSANAHTFKDADSSGYLVFNSSSDGVITIDNSLTVGFSCAAANIGTGGVSILTTEGVLGETELQDKDGIMSISKPATGIIQTSERLNDAVDATNVAFSHAGMTATNIHDAITELRSLIAGYHP